MVFGTNALITKPAISMAPMLAVWLFNKYGYDKLKTPATSAAVDLDSLHSAMFNLTSLTPVVVGFLEVCVWSLYTIRHSHETIPKHLEV